ncbi:MAG: hypothetical protein LKE29_09700 [Acidaminococcaceae bacterium]|nr:hypothetical protein [Acidaminococcaceae bacterium]
MKTFTEDTGKKLNLTNFLDYYQINPRLFYVKEDLFMDYVAAAKLNHWIILKQHLTIEKVCFV